MEDLKIESLEYKIIKEYLIDLKKKFGGENDKIVKVAELKKVEQGNMTIEEFI